MIVGCSNIVFFFLHDIHLLQKNKKVFGSLRLKILNTTDHRLCCFIKYEAECTSVRPWYVSCDNLMGIIRIKICCHCISITIISLNLIYFILQSLSSLNSFKIITISINMIDFSYGLCLVVLLMSDQYFYDNFLSDYMKLRSNFMCLLSFSLILNFSLCSPLSFSLLSVQRCLVIVYPLIIKYKNKHFVSKWLTGIFTTSIIFVLVTCVLLKSLKIIMPLTTCTPFVDPTNSIPLIKIIIWLVVVLQFGATFVIIITYSILVSKLWTSNNIMLGQNLKNKHLPVILQIIILTVSNIICWIPSGIIYLTLVFLDKYSIGIALWTPVVITPINSIVNPIIFSIATRHDTQ